jgi:hypothetical protein
VGGVTLTTSAPTADITAAIVRLNLLMAAPALFGALVVRPRVRST